jgi:RNA polymerase sigma factor (sigma-70 family)
VRGGFVEHLVHGEDLLLLPEGVGRVVRDEVVPRLGGIAEVDRWIQSAARPFFRRLSYQWDDVLQDVRLEVFKALSSGQFRGDANLKTYVWRVVSHSCLDLVRKATRWRWTDVEESSEAQEIADQRAQDETVSLSTTDLLTRVMEQVSEDCRRLWQMLFAGLSYKEMSGELDVKEGALRVRVLRCRKKATEIRDVLMGEET